MFQSTPAYGGRHAARGVFSTQTEFQSTPAYGGRLLFVADTFRLYSFNPRPRMAGDSRPGILLPGL